jgi:hypothetical protein
VGDLLTHYEVICDPFALRRAKGGAEVRI